MSWLPSNIHEWVAIVMLILLAILMVLIAVSNGIDVFKAIRNGTLFTLKGMTDLALFIAISLITIRGAIWLYENIIQ